MLVMELLTEWIQHTYQSHGVTTELYHVCTWVQGGLLQLRDLLDQCGVVRMQAPVSSQQEATEPAVPCVSSLQAVLAGHVKASLRRGGRTKETSAAFVGQPSPADSRVCPPAFNNGRVRILEFYGRDCTGLSLPKPWRLDFVSRLETWRKILGSFGPHNHSFAVSCKSRSMRVRGPLKWMRSILVMTF